MTKSTGRQSILTEAETLINGPRRVSYGDAKESFVRLAKLFSEVLKQKLTAPITPHESALLLVVLKLSREIGKPDRENRIDGSAYFELADQVADINCDGYLKTFASNTGEKRKNK